MMSSSMMRDRYYYQSVNEQEKADDSEACICGYKLRSDSEYINNQNQSVSIMICDSCGAIEHWVNDNTTLIVNK